MPGPGRQGSARPPELVGSLNRRRRSRGRLVTVPARIDYDNDDEDVNDWRNGAIPLRRPPSLQRLERRCPRRPPDQANDLVPVR
jgi:hypothetical protein